MSLALELVDPIRQATRAETIWRDLEASARPSYFQTWGWVENWLAMLPRADVPRLVVLRDDGAITGALFLGQRTIHRHRVVSSRALFLNATGVPSFDELCVEHNGVLGAAPSLAQLVERLPADWDELFLPGVDRDAFATLDVPRGYQLRIEREVASPHIELDRVRAAGDYLALLSPNTRSQLRRARRRAGPLTLDVASSVSEALAFYDELVALHGASWRARGLPGAFADPWFERFHHRLIERRFAHGEIQLLRVRAGATTLGCLYNLVAGGRVLFYQSGLVAHDDPVVKPGLLAHAEAIAYCAASGHAVYDLLGGDARYKASLATGATRLAWLCVQRSRLRFAIENRVRAWKHAALEVLP